MKQISILIFLTSMMLFSCTKEELETEKPEIITRSELATIDKKVIYQENTVSYSAQAASGVDELMRGADNATWLLTANGDFKMSITIDAKNLKNNNTIDIKSDWESKESIQITFKGEQYSTRDMTIEPVKMGSISIEEYNGRAIKGSFSCTMRTRKGKSKEFKNIQFSSEVVKY
jgi:hypothetical protein